MFFVLTANRRAAGRSPDAGGRGRRFSRAGSDHSGGCRAARVAAISAEDGRWACMLFSCYTILHIYTAAVWVESGFHTEKLHVCLSRRGIILNKLEASWRRERYHHSYLITGCIIETVMLIKADFFFPFSFCDPIIIPPDAHETTQIIMFHAWTQTQILICNSLSV